MADISWGEAGEAEELVAYAAWLNTALAGDQVATATPGWLVTITRTGPHAAPGRGRRGPVWEAR